MDKLSIDTNEANVVSTLALAYEDMILTNVGITMHKANAYNTYNKIISKYTSFHRIIHDDKTVWFYMTYHHYSKVSLLMSLFKEQSKNIINTSNTNDGDLITINEYDTDLQQYVYDDDGIEDNQEINSMSASILDKVIHVMVTDSVNELFTVAFNDDRTIKSYYITESYLSIMPKFKYDGSYDHTKLVQYTDKTSNIELTLSMSAKNKYKYNLVYHDFKLPILGLTRHSQFTRTPHDDNIVSLISCIDDTTIRDVADIYPLYTLKLLDNIMITATACDEFDETIISYVIYNKQGKPIFALANEDMLESI